MSNMFTTDAPSGSKPKTGLFIALGVIAVLLIAGITALVTWNSVINDGNRMEQDLSRAYTNGQLTLSNCTNKTVAAANVAGAQTDALRAVYRDAVGGRYGNGSDLDRNKLFSALQEAYPDLTGLNQTFDKALAIMTGCQDDFTNAQREVTVKVANFNTWRTGTMRVRFFGGGFPNDELQVNVQGLPRETGRAALDRMSLPIVDASASEAYATGQTTNTNPFQKPEQTTTPPR